SVDVEVEPCAQGAILVQQAELSSRPAALAERYGDFAAGIDARSSDTVPGCQYVLRFRQQQGLGGPGSSTSYSYEVDSTNGTFGLRYSPPGDDPGRFVWIVGPMPSPVVRRGTATNRLAIIA